MKFLHRFLILATIPAAHAWSPSQQPPALPLASFVLPEGLEITPWATSPALFNPTHIDIDHKGLVWVAEGVNYRRKLNPDGTHAARTVPIWNPSASVPVTTPKRCGKPSARP